MVKAELKYSDVIKVKRKSCNTCLTLIYSFPCEIDKSITGYMTAFGKSKYDLNTISLIQIEGDDAYAIRGKLKQTALSFSIPKRFEDQNLNEKTRRPEFERCLIKWIENKLNIKILK